MRFRIFLKNGSKWYIDHPIWLNCLFWAIPPHIGKFFCYIPNHPLLNLSPYCPEMPINTSFGKYTPVFDSIYIPLRYLSQVLNVPLHSETIFMCWELRYWVAALLLASLYMNNLMCRQVTNLTARPFCCWHIAPTAPSLPSSYYLFLCSYCCELPMAPCYS